MRTIVRDTTQIRIVGSARASPLRTFHGIGIRNALGLTHRTSDVKIHHFIFVDSVGIGNRNASVGRPCATSTLPTPMSPCNFSGVRTRRKLQRVTTRSNVRIIVVQPALICNPKIGTGFLGVVH